MENYYNKDNLTTSYELYDIHGSDSIKTDINFDYDISDWEDVEAFNQLKYAAQRSAAMAFLFSYRFLNKKPFPEGEFKISQDAKYSFLYSRDILNHRFYMGESSIATSSKYSLSYSSLWGEFPLGEASIAQNNFEALHYSTKVICKTFPLGEEEIFKDHYTALKYCQAFGKAFPEAIDSIKLDSYSSYSYSKLMKERFIEGESSIRLTPEYARKYSCRFGLSDDVWKEAIFKDPREAFTFSKHFKYRGDDLEDIICQSGSWSLEYAIFHNTRFPKGEEAIIKNKDYNELYIKHLKSLSGRL